MTGIVNAKPLLNDIFFDCKEFGERILMEDGKWRDWRKRYESRNGCSWPAGGATSHSSHHVADRGSFVRHTETHREGDNLEYVLVPSCEVKILLWWHQLWHYTRKLSVYGWRRTSSVKLSFCWAITHFHPAWGTFISSFVDTRKKGYNRRDTFFIEFIWKTDKVGGTIESSMIYHRTTDQICDELKLLF